MSLPNVRNFVRPWTLVAFDVSYGMILSSERAWLDSIFDSVQCWDVRFVSFAERVIPGFDPTPGRAGGGTDFGPLTHYVDQAKPERVIVVTDGIASHVEPSDPSRWLWVLPTRSSGRGQVAPSWMKMMRVEYVDLQVPFVIAELP